MWRLPLVILVLPASAAAVDGIVVNTRNGTGSLQYYGTIDGELWRHDIVNDVVTQSFKIHDGPATRPAISPDGTRVAFIKKTGDATGKVAMIAIDGTGEVELADCLRNSLVDFPHDDWVYFTVGGFHESTSGLLERVHAQTRIEETVMQVKGRSGAANTRIAQIQISSDLTRAVVRTGDEESEPDGEIVALALDDDDRLDHTLGPQYSCAAGFFHDGEHAMDGWAAHDGFDILAYTDASNPKSFSNAEAFGWAPHLGSTSPDNHHAIFNTGAATNSDRWLCIVTGGDRDFKWDTMFLINWKDERCIFVTQGLAGPWDHGDFWVGVPDVVVDSTPPVIVGAATQSGIDDTVVVTFSEVLSAATAEVSGNYTIDNGVTVSAAALAGDTVTLTTSTLATGTYQLTVSAVEDVAGNPIAPGSTVGFTYSATQQNQAPLVSAGDDQNTYVGALTTLVGAVSDDGLPTGNPLTATWSVTAGNAGDVAFGDASSATTTVSFAAEGSFTLTLVGDDGELQASDDVVVEVAAEQSITLLSPVGGESWVVGSVHQIEWTTTSVDDVMILFSPDDGESWQPLVSTVDTQSPEWGSFAWTLPDTPTDTARISIDAYLRGTVQPPTSRVFAIVEEGSQEAGPVVLKGGCACGNSSPLWGSALLLLALRRRKFV